MVGSTGKVRYRSFIHDSARWDGFEFRDGDIVVSTSPKCGTTWTQMICALLIFQTPELPAKLSVLSPWLDMQTNRRDDVVAALDAQTHRRFIKTHTPLDGLPDEPTASYLCVGRDPRDVGLSWDDHMANMNIDALMTARGNAVGFDDLGELPASEPPAPDPIEHFWQWTESDSPPTDNISTLRAVLHHVATYWGRRTDENIALVHYSDLCADLDGEMRRIAAFLGIDVDPSLWPALVEAATFDHMRERADDVAPDVGNHIWQDNKAFFRRGGVGERWRSMLDDEGLARYERRLDALIASGETTREIVDWLHR